MNKHNDMNIKLAIVGGDLRSIVCAKKLAGMGFECAIFGFSAYVGDFGGVTKTADLQSAIRDAKAVILPVPVSCDGKHLNCPFCCSEIALNDVFSMICPETTILAGHICQKVNALVAKYELKIIDYSNRDEFKIANAIPTAEGAIAIAINETPKTIHNSRCLVIGYGRIGKILCNYLNALGAKVTASARKYSDFAWIKANNCTPVNTEEITKIAHEYDIIFNTVPTMIIGKQALSDISKNTLILDLASKPGGVDFDAAKELGLNVIWALSLPGKSAPVSSGEIMCDSIINILKEEKIQ